MFLIVRFSPASCYILPFKLHKIYKLLALYFSYLGSLIANDTRCMREIKSRIAMTKAAFNKKKTLFISNMDLNLRKKQVTCYI